MEISWVKKIQIYHEKSFKENLVETLDDSMVSLL